MGVKATKNVIKKLETSVRNNMNNAKEFLKEQLDEDPAIWTKKKAKKIEEGLKNFLQNWDLDNVFMDQEQDEQNSSTEKQKDMKKGRDKSFSKKIEKVKHKEEEFEKNKY